MANMSKKWIVLCTAAIATVYAAGYWDTESQATIPNAAADDQVLQAASSEPSINNTYKDGIYSGTGMNRRGSIQVTITIEQDRIMDVEISDFAMHYSESDIVGLPDEVTQSQSATVDNVSGATYSTAAFEDAVQDALAQAAIH
ncbi:FMN-binding protein [Paenibacillus glycinis]|uniref:FMN-binding protein n=1 Tax=Paenibacillus glycinis TaxID=2697035 RepID=A0ABW9XRL9_9BACL|nr:FMN-binding protein [Paenibacillus glycinis]NBD25004.1 FMN-binding protein [Paenibacillus glycinis]